MKSLLSRGGGGSPGASPASTEASWREETGCSCFSGLLRRKKDTGVTSAVRLRLSNSSPKRLGSELDYRHLLLAPDPSREISRCYSDFVQIGVGGFGSVWKAKSTHSGTWCAVKQVPKTKVAEDMEFVNSELEAMIKLDHPNVVKFFEYFEDSRLMYIVTELCEGGDFCELNHGIDDPKEIKRLFKDSIMAVSYCHDHGVAHRDLKFENCLIHKVPGQRKVGKVIDFGLAGIQRPGGTGLFNDQLGTRYFVAPEVIDNKTDYDVKCDVWSLGVMLYIILADEHPIASDANRMDTRQLFRRTLLKPIREEPLEDAEVEPEARDLIMKMLTKSPQKRISAREVLNHPWIMEKGRGCHSWKSHSMMPGKKKEKRPKEDSDKATLGADVVSRLQGFGSFSRFEKAVLTLVAHQSHCHEVEEMRATFSELDTSNTGTLSKEEIREGLTLSGHRVTDEDLTQLFNSLDLDGTGKISYTEWLAATMQPAMLQQDHSMKQVFNFLDIDRTGKVNRRDLVQILGDDVAAQTALKRYDVADDGCLSFDEFVAVMQNISKRLQEATP